MEGQKSSTATWRGGATREGSATGPAEGETHFAAARSRATGWVAFALAFALLRTSAWADAPPLERWSEQTVVSLQTVRSFGPFWQVTWEWKSRGGAPLWVASRQPGPGLHHESTLQLVDSALYEPAQQAVIDACARVRWQRGSGRVDEEDDVPSVRITWLEGREQWFAPLDPDSPVDRSCIGAVREPLRVSLRFPPFRMPWWDGVPTGRIRAESDLPAWLWVDDRPTFEVTPVSDLIVPAGERRLRWVSIDGRRVREERIRVEEGRTTTIRVRLESEQEEAPAWTPPTPQTPRSGDPVGRSFR
jgi:hypothetical protein